MRVYLVDDSAVFRTALRLLLASIPGVSIVGEAEDTTEAVDGIVATRPDLVLLDLVLRTGTGFPVLVTVQNHLPATRVFVLTNNTAQQYRERSITLGADRFFDKSTDLDACFAACRALVIADRPPSPGAPT